MPIRAITFDCAQTLVEVEWNPGQFAIQAAEEVGICLTSNALEVYKALYAEWLPEFIRVNRLRSASAGREFYNRLNSEWLRVLGFGASLGPRVTAAAEERAFGPRSSLFRVYDDTVAALTALKSNGYKLAVVSNWDYSLHRVLEMFGLHQFLDASVASLEEGVEKPDPKLFQIALSRLGCRAAETLHVGDDPLDDLEGAKAAGVFATLIDRTLPSDLPRRLSSLLQIPEALACLA